MTFRKTLGVPILLNTCDKLLIKLHIWHYKQSEQLANSRLSKPRLEEGPTPRLTNVDFLLWTRAFKRSTWIHYFGGIKYFSCQKTQTGFWKSNSLGY